MSPAAEPRRGLNVIDLRSGDRIHRVTGGIGKDWYLRNSLGLTVANRDTITDFDADSVFTEIDTWSQDDASSRLSFVSRSQAPAWERRSSTLRFACGINLATWTPSRSLAELRSQAGAWERG